MTIQEIEAMTKNQKTLISILPGRAAFSQITDQPDEDDEIDEEEMTQPPLTDEEIAHYAELMGEGGSQTERQAYRLAHS